MPWKTEDVDRFKGGLSDEQKRRWVAIANGALAECLKEEGADELECEVKAVRVANATVDGKEKAAALALADRPNPLHVPGGAEDVIHVALAQASRSDDEYQLAFPIGLFRTGKYGELIVTRTFAERMAKNWESKALGERGVFMDVNHDFDQAAAWASDMRVTDEGLEIAWSFNARGRELIADRRYRYYSAAIGAAVDSQTGDLVYPVLHAVSLTNMPVMNTMPAAHLADKGQSPAHRDRETNKEGSMDSLKDVMAALSALSDDELGKATDQDRAQIAQVLSIETGDAKAIAELTNKLSVEQDKVRTLMADNTELATELSSYRDNEKKAARDKVIEAALAEGKILPKNRERWERIYDADPEGTEQLLAEKAREIDYDKTGTSRAERSFAGDEGFDVFRLMNPGMSLAEATEAFAAATKDEE